MKIFSTFSILFVLAMSVADVSAQTDSIFFHNGKVIAAQLVSTGPHSLTYRVPNRGTALFTNSNYSVHRIKFVDGSMDTVSKRIDITSEEDWEQVILLEDVAAVAGLVRKQEIKGNSALFNLHTPQTADAKAWMNIKKAAARLGCPFVFMNQDRESTLSPLLIGIGSKQVIKRGIAYNY